jgi:hypothetical protein
MVFFLKLQIDTMASPKAVLSSHSTVPETADGHGIKGANLEVSL